MAATAQPGALPQGIALKARGTGRTTGHIATLEIRNKTNAPITWQAGPFLIPALNGAQGYGVPDVLEVTVLPRQTVVLPLHGYCTNPFLPPVDEGKDLPPVDTWVIPGEEPFFVPGVPLSREDGFIPAQPTDTIVTIYYPGTDTPFPYTIHIDAHPRSAAKLVIDIIRAASHTYHHLDSLGLIRTPLAGQPHRQKETVIQQVVWIALGIVTGRNYTREHFHNNLLQQFDLAVNTPFLEAPSTVKESFEQGVDAFWNTFQLVGKEAKILP